MITPSFGLTATERVLPKLALDFTTASLDPRVTFTRSGDTATVINSSGFIAPINANLPRFDFDPLTLACKGLLIEEQRTNLLTYSSQLNEALWTKTNSTVSADEIVSPDGTANADKLVETTATGNHLISAQGNAAAATAYTLSIYVKAGERTKGRLRYGTNIGFVAAATFDLSTGTVTGTGASIVNAGNNWFRVSITGTTQASTTFVQLAVYLQDASGVESYTGDGVSGFYLWGAQLEAGAFPTSYIPTTTTAVTRNADVATMTGTNFSDWFNAVEGSFATTFVKNGASNFQTVLSVSDNSFNNQIVIGHGSGAPNNNLRFDITNGGVSQASITTIAPTVVGTTYKSVAAYKVNLIAASTNASTPGTDTSATIPTVSKLSVGSNATNAGGFLNGTIQNINYWPQRLINAEVQAFSKLG